VELATLYSIIAIIFYFAGAIAIISRLFDSHGPNRKLVIILGTIAVLSHSLSLGNNLYLTTGVNFNLPNVISLVSLIISAGMTIMALRYKASLILPMVYGFSGLLMLALLFVPEVSNTTIDSNKLTLVSHITLAILSYCILVIATLYSIQVEYINYKLKSKELMAVSNLPPLMQVESQLFSIMAAGTICLALSQLLGFIFIDGFYSQERAHETVLSMFAFAFYLLILWGHFKQGWRGYKVMWLTLLATFILTLSYFGSRFIKEFLLI
jgi:ABC-type uncharacterized transport system permease subunit